ncbi:DUF4855 domain-containing protein [Niabella drilacis]|uniref:DUF4855 domain-containing protein n=1 Tax=Niabella drilacis (strain DSM 25811 / CCM 8410 / CCUG 62505 / LMG 26954 / E90) TaxID=1285928 RepID=A0A1G6M5B4_NIADE|nr:DUF4855 domain-containing protein [Niabella drilacis]SDC50547.1 protein of unknown function [Niabella drilacis]
MGIRKIKAALIGMGVLLQFLSAHAQQYLPLASPQADYITDLALIYQGGAHRPDWTAEQLTPYVYRQQGKKTDFLFDGFLFIEFKNGKGKDYSIGYEKEHAGKEEWSWLLDRNFEQGKAIHALNDVLSGLAKKRIKPLRKRKVVLTLPEPIYDQKDWGMLDGKMLSFDNEESRFLACKWYIDDALDRWSKAGLDQVELSGFYWVAEQSTGGKTLIPRIAEYIRSKKMKFYWIPYWKAEGHGSWKAAGFDAAYQQPNHFFDEHIPDSRIDEACDFAKQHEMGMELEFDMRVEQPAFEKRLITYIGGFQKKGVLDEAAMAYYEGGNGIMKLSGHKEARMRELYQKLAAIIAGRQQKADAYYKQRRR